MSDFEGSDHSQNMLSRLIRFPLAMTFPAASCWLPGLFHIRVEIVCGRVWDFLHQHIAL